MMMNHSRAYTSQTPKPLMMGPEGIPSHQGSHLWNPSPGTNEETLRAHAEMDHVLRSSWSTPGRIAKLRCEEAFISLPSFSGSRWKKTIQIILQTASELN